MSLRKKICYLTMRVKNKMMGKIKTFEQAQVEKYNSKVLRQQIKLSSGKSHFILFFFLFPPILKEAK